MLVTRNAREQQDGLFGEDGAASQAQQEQQDRDNVAADVQVRVHGVCVQDPLPNGACECFVRAV